VPDGLVIGATAAVPIVVVLQDSPPPRFLLLLFASSCLFCLAARRSSRCPCTHNSSRADPFKHVRENEASLVRSSQGGGTIAASWWGYPGHFLCAVRHGTHAATTSACFRPGARSLHARARIKLKAQSNCCVVASTQREREREESTLGVLPRQGRRAHTQQREPSSCWQEVRVFL
jgi:hypothetical protein